MSALPSVIIFSGPNGVGKTTQGELAVRRLLEHNVAAVAIDSWGDLIKPRIYPEHTTRDHTWRFSLRTEPGMFERSRNAERDINLAGDFNSPDWVSWLAQRGIREALLDGVWPVMTGSARTPLEGREVAAEIAAQRDEGVLGGAIMVRLDIDIELAKERILARAEAMPPKQQERERYKVKEMEKRFGWYYSDTVPAFEVLLGTVEASGTPMHVVDLLDDGTRSADEMSEAIWREIWSTGLLPEA